MQFLVVLVVAELFVKYFWVLVAGIALAWLVWIAVREWRRWQADAAAVAQRIDNIRARADQQHAWVMRVDPRGTFGESLGVPT